MMHAIKSGLNNFNLANISLKRDTNPVLPSKLKILLHNKKGCKDMYKLLIKKTITPKAQIKFSKLGLGNSPNQWKKHYSLTQTITTDTTLIWYQYQILHRILATKELLYKMKYVDSDLCDFCNQDTETIEHLLYECDIVKVLWRDTERWIKNTTGQNTTFTKNTIIFGMENDKDNTVPNWLILNIKYEIFKSKQQKRKPNILAIQNVIKKKL